MRVLGMIVATLLSFPVAAQTNNCALRDTVVEKLTAVGETQAGIGLQNQGSILEIWSSETTGTWTVVMTFTNGLSCIMAFGDSWSSGTVANVKQGGAPA